ncbi:MAG: single-stranded DNA-binding protein [Clostridia bacterium]|nr:single-stranded DNA-binding protein [Clostridia bacterium]
MDTNYLENNYLTLVGKVTGEKNFSHEIYGESFYVFNLEIPRLSGNSDIIPITVSERLIKEDTLQEGKKLLVKGQFRSYNSYENEKNRLILTVFAKDIMEVEDVEEDEENEIVKKDIITNEVVLIGYICKKPIYRQTPFGREISDILLAVNRAYNKSDYIPCIAWGRNARFCQNLEVGSQVKIVGRVQSRMYEKKHEDGTVENRVAYEVSVGSLEVIEEKTDENENETENQEAV